VFVNHEERGGAGRVRPLVLGLIFLPVGSRPAALMRARHTSFYASISRREIDRCNCAECYLLVNYHGV
jgi:hypothetical protein